MLPFAQEVTGRVEWRSGGVTEANPLLAREHYLGPVGWGRLVVIGDVDGDVVAAQVWRHPSSRRLPSDRWLELSRWCLTAAAGPSAGSRQHAAAVRMIRRELPGVAALVSYSDPTQGHTGALYRACNWRWCPTWHRLRPPPSGHGRWAPMSAAQAVKDRWVFALARPRHVEPHVAVADPGALRAWRARATEGELRLARESYAADLREAATR